MARRPKVISTLRVRVTDRRAAPRQTMKNKIDGLQAQFNVAFLKRAAERPVLVQFVDIITGIGAPDSVVLTAAATNGRGGVQIITVPMSLLNAAAKIVADRLVNAGSLPVVGDVAGRKRD